MWTKKTNWVFALCELLPFSWIGNAVTILFNWLLFLWKLKYKQEAFKIKVYVFVFLSVHGSVLSLASNASSNYSTVRPLFTFCFSVWNLFESNSKSCYCCHHSCILDCGKANQSQMFLPCTMAHSNEWWTKDKNHLLYWLSLSTDQYFHQDRTDSQVAHIMCLLPTLNSS